MEGRGVGVRYGERLGCHGRQYVESVEVLRWKRWPGVSSGQLQTA